MLTNEAQLKIFSRRVAFSIEDIHFDGNNNGKTLNEELNAAKKQRTLFFKLDG